MLPPNYKRITVYIFIWLLKSMILNYKITKLNIKMSPLDIVFGYKLQSKHRKPFNFSV